MSKYHDDWERDAALHERLDKIHAKSQKRMRKNVGEFVLIWGAVFMVCVALLVAVISFLLNRISVENYDGPRLTWEEPK